MDVQKKPLYQIALAAGLQPRALPDAAGGLLLSAHGARVLGIYLDGTPDNLLWTNPALCDGDIARRFVAAGEWNLGGARCWLAPELELHFRDPDHPAHTNYVVPAAIDPGAYTVQRDEPTGLTLQTCGEALNQRSQRPFRFEIRRNLSLCGPPIAPTGVSYVGYELISELKITAADRPDARYGLWQLMQLPPGGTVFVPVRRRPEIVDYFATDVRAHCRADGDHVAFPINGHAMHKLGLTAADTTGIMAYFRVVSDEVATLIVRKAEVAAGALYADYPGHTPHRRDIALQIYNGDAEVGGYGEMEYHSAAAWSSNSFQVRDVSRAWCFAGPIDAVRSVARQLPGLGGLELT